MSKELILARSHFRKNRGTSVGLLLLMILAGIMLTVSLIIILDIYPTAEKEASRLNAGDGSFRLLLDVKGLDDDVLAGILEKDASEFEIRRDLDYMTVSVPFGDGMITDDVILAGSEVFSSTMDRIEIVEEDTGITSDYLYLPYQF